MLTASIFILAGRVFLFFRPLFSFIFIILFRRRNNFSTKLFYFLIFAFLMFTQTERKQIDCDKRNEIQFLLRFLFETRVRSELSLFSFILFRHSSE